MARLETATLVASWTRRVADAAEREGLGAAPFLARAGIDRAVLDDPTGRVPFASHAALVQALGERLDDPGFGLSIGTRAGAADFGVVGLLAESCANLGEALGCVQRWNALANEASRMEYWRDGARVVVCDAHFRDGRPVPPALAEATLAFYVTVIRAATGVREPVVEVRLAHSSHRGWTRARREHFAAELRFDAGINAIVLPGELLEATFATARADVGSHLRALADRLERDLGDLDDVCLRVAAHVRRVLARGPEPIGRTARALGTSTRTLQRRLEQEGVSYAELVDRVRRREVEALLAQRDRSLSEIAERAGYSDARALRRACVRWFGQSASAIRRDDAAE